MNDWREFLIHANAKLTRTLPSRDGSHRLLCNPLFVADLALGDFTECRVFSGKLLERFDERTIPAPELLHPTGHYVDQNIRVTDNFKGGLQVIISHVKFQPGPRIRHMGRADFSGILAEWGILRIVFAEHDA